MRQVLVYGDINLNYRDGSAIWLLSFAQCLAQTRSNVYLLLKSDVRDAERLSELENCGVTVLTPFDDKTSGFAGMGARQAAQRIAILDRRHNFDTIISRGFDIASHLAISGRFTGRLWPYLTEGPAFEYRRTDHQEELLTRIGDEARRVFVQTEDARSILETNMPTATGKTLLMNPIVPDEAFSLGNKRSATACPSPDKLSLVYAGKFARLWHTLEMTELPEELQKLGVDAHLHMVGDKFQLTDGDHDWLASMKAAATKDNPDLTWHGGMQRARALEVVAKADIGLCWRHPELDRSPEVSTKMLEYSALGTPPVLNRTAIHEELLGKDYPLFVEGENILRLLTKAATTPSIMTEAREAATTMAEAFSMSSTVQRFKHYFERAEGRTGRSVMRKAKRRPHRVLVAGHDFKFAADLIDMLTQRSDIELKIDQWHRLAVHDEKASREYAKWADIVICEWAGPNAVFYSKVLRPEQRLLIRFHGFEIRGQWLEDIDIDNVNGIVFVSDFYRRQVLHTTGWPEHKTTVLYNTVDQTDLLRPKLSRARFHIGLAGYVPMLKRPDRAVELLRQLLSHDDRYYLRVRGKEPWNYPWEWNKPVQRDAYREFFYSVAHDPIVRDHVVFEPFGPDMGNWFRKIGWMLSPSTRETFHLAPVEGMMSGAVPIVWDRVGADEIFGTEFVHSDIESAAQFILDNTNSSRYSDLQELSINRALKYEISESRRHWMNLITAENGSPIELNGISILEGVDKPRDQAETTALFYAELNRNGFAAAYEAVQDTLELLEPNLRLQVKNYAQLVLWASKPESILPSRNLAPLFNPRDNSALEFGPELSGLDSWHKTQGTEILATGDFYVDALVAADEIVRQARRVRPALIISSGPLWKAFGALIAARRLGISFVRGHVEVPDEPDFMASIYQDLTELFMDEAASVNEFLTKPEPVAAQSRPLSSITVGLIADEFTSETISAEVNTIFLDRYEWQEQLNTVDAVIVESAWEGLNKQWFHGVAYHGENEAQNLWEILQTCKSRGIPTVFWNKEDPIHFRSFAKAAGRCDHIFTTDAAMIPNYITSEHNAARSVSSLSFFAQPKIHNPLKDESKWKNTASFAGTYYGKRYAKRSEELRMILETAAEKGLTIYDRQHGKSESPYQFPPELQKYSEGALPYQGVLEAYKSHPVHINVNSVNDSPSMFSRRVVEIAASGSLVLSGKGDGIERTLGEAFPVLETAADWEKHLQKALTDENARIKAVLNQFKTVLASHRADQAIALMLRTAGLNVNVTPLPKVGWLANNRSIVNWAYQQTLQPVILTEHQEIRRFAENLGLSVIAPDEALQAGLSYLGAPVRAPKDTHCEDLMFVALLVDADYLSVENTGISSDALIQPGFGQSEIALWSASLSSPSAAIQPYKIRVPQ